MSEKRKIIRRRRKRRQFKAANRHGKKAKPTHKNPKGRTGSIMEKKNHSKKKSGYHVSYTFVFPYFVESK